MNTKNLIQCQLVIYITKCSYLEKKIHIFCFCCSILVKFHFFNLNLKKKEKENFDLFANASHQTTKYQSSKYAIKWITMTETEFCLL